MLRNLSLSVAATPLNCKVLDYKILTLKKQILCVPGNSIRTLFTWAADS